MKTRPQCFWGSFHVIWQVSSTNSQIRWKPAYHLYPTVAVQFRVKSGLENNLKATYQYFSRWSSHNPVDPADFNLEQSLLYCAVLILRVFFQKWILVIAFVFSCSVCFHFRNMVKVVKIEGGFFVCFKYNHYFSFFILVLITLLGSRD